MKNQDMDQEGLFREAMRLVSDGVMITSGQLLWPDQEIVVVNDRITRISGYTRDELLGQTPRIFHGQDTNPETLERIKKELSAGRSVVAQLTNYRKDGTPYNAEIFITPHFGQNEIEPTVRSIAIYRECGEQTRLNEAIHESEARLRMLIEHTPLALAMFDRQMRYLFASRRWMMEYGIDIDPSGRSHYDLFPKISESWKDAFRKGLEGEIVRNIHDRTVRADGTVQWKSWEIRPWHVTAGSVGGIVISSEDVTEQREAEERLRVSEECFRKVVDHSPIGIIFTDKDGHARRCNPAFLKMIGYSEDECRQLQFSSIIHQEERDAHGNLFQRLQRGEIPSFEVKTRCIHKNGGVLWIRLFASCLTEERSRPNELFILATDVTESIRSDERIQADLAAMTRLHDVGTLFVQNGDIGAVLHAIIEASMSIMHADFGNIQLVDPATERLKIVAQKGFDPWWIEFWNSADEKSGTCGVASKTQEQVIVEDVEQSPIFIGTEALDAQRRMGVRAVISTPLISRSGKLLGSFSTHYRMPHHPNERSLKLLDLLARQAADIIDRKGAQDSLRQREEHLSAILNTATDAIISINSKGIITTVNSATEKMFGYRRDELIGQNVKLLMPKPYYDEHDDYIDCYRKTRKPKIIGVGREVLAKRKDGSTFPIDLSVTEIDHLDMYAGIIRDISERKALERDILTATEDEQRRIGQDLHDSVQQELVGLGLLAETLLKKLARHARLPEDAPTSGEAGATGNADCELLQKIIDGIQRTQKDVRYVAKGLVPIRLTPMGLMDALQELASRTEDRTGITCAFKCEELVTVDNSLIATNLYRIAQEAVANAIKHGHPKHILIALESEDGKAVLQIADDGIGFDLAEKHDGLGLKSMRYRTSLIGADLTISPVETGGTLVTCNVFLGGK